MAGLLSIPMETMTLKSWLLAAHFARNKQKKLATKAG
tara:strand:+ start:9978 stop:10088 length:111 start_codon:yes stop_codon:yes gene_type:complete